ncbi:MAG: AAA family ATPase [Gammaproteobacteria bacterium AqS3]|nr:AAA family ATPase [Gammaproteobacteria bacterium AqS3]
MKLDYVEICGFRGYREKIRVTFGSGFTVITGRNGVGKSTLLDAVEFALTGSINKYAFGKSAKESISDYLWWRGEGSPNNHYVTVSFKNGDNKNFSITRTKKSGNKADKELKEIENALCYRVKPDDALHQLCQSLIIRDEWISALGLDLSETEHFKRVHSALGAVQKTDFVAKAQNILENIKAKHKLNQKAYSDAHNQLTDALAQLSEAKEDIVETEDIAVAKQTLDAATSDDFKDITSYIISGRSALIEGQRHLARINEMIRRGYKILEDQREFDKKETVAAREVVKDRLELAKKLKAEADDIFEDKQRIFSIEKEANSFAASLALIVEHGEKIGLHGENCPLCSAARTDEEFLAGLVSARERMESLSAGFAVAQQQMDEARDIVNEKTDELMRLQEKWSEIQEEESRLVSLQQEHKEVFELYGLDFQLIQDPQAADKYVAAERERLIDLERALLTLEASQTVVNISLLEDRVEILRKEVDAAAFQVEKSESALDKAKAMERGVRSILDEITKERLAQISPLLEELYQRLRPHHDWRFIKYSMRGNLRRSLSLEVGEGLNPQFFFSSGQRRVLGLAVLLSVYLARPWTPLRTLILDDPVQHIDDFRAIHLIELLAAICLDDRQIICVVEDSALADVLCRRLSGASDGTGRRYDLEIGKDGAATIKSEREIPPMPQRIMRSGTEIHLIN